MPSQSVKYSADFAQIRDDYIRGVIAEANILNPEIIGSRSHAERAVAILASTITSMPTINMDGQKIYWFLYNLLYGLAAFQVSDVNDSVFKNKLSSAEALGRLAEIRKMTEDIFGNIEEGFKSGLGGGISLPAQS